MKKGFLTNIVYSNGLWIAGLLLLLLSVIGNIVYFGVETKNVLIPAFSGLYGQDILGFQLDQLFRNTLVGYIFRFLMLLGSAIILQNISSDYRLIRVRSFFPFFLFCVFSATILPAIPLDGSSISCLLLCWSFFRLFAVEENGSANRAVFDAMVLLAIASLFHCRLLFLLPVFWMVMGVLQIFSFKSFLASIIGFLSVFWIIGGVSFLLEDYTFLLNYVNELVAFDLVDFNSFSTAEIAYISFVGILMISAMVSFWPRQNLDKLRTRNYLNSILLLWFSFLVLWLFSGNDMGILLMLFCLSSLMAAHFFSLMDTRYSRALFVLFILLSIFVYFLIGR